MYSTPMLIFIKMAKFSKLIECFEIYKQLNTSTGANLEN